MNPGVFAAQDVLPSKVAPSSKVAAVSTSSIVAEVHGGPEVLSIPERAARPKPNVASSLEVVVSPSILVVEVLEVPSIPELAER